MRNFKKIISSTVILLVVLAFNSMAQTTTINKPAHKVKHHAKGKMAENLTEEQKAQMKESRGKDRAANEAFRATLTPEQKAIKENKNLTPEQRKEAFGKTLTTSQKEMMKNNMTARKENAKSFKATLTDEQKEQMKINNEKRKQKPAKELGKKE